MKVYHFTKRLWINTSLEEAWNFFTSPENLARITPDYMKFNIVGDAPNGSIYEGMIISYKVHPLLSIPMNWITEITHVEHQKRFIDEQRFGPYKFWHHQHHFIREKKGVMMEDIVHYAVGFSFLGKIMNRFVIRNKLEEIFEFRKDQVNFIFSSS